ncbi:hypothetical protein Tco_0911609 [Tanacetum coccineum]|uniref:Uncharacterized protein n=1 Tax=Tanacetum coccineum TaxID=301880 RepID=A0ABQ5D2L8_9ASTR
MSSTSSTVTYTSVYTYSELGRVFWGADEEISDGGILRAYDPDYVPEPIYPEYIPLEDEHELPAEEQPLPPVDSPTAESPGDDVENEDEDEDEEDEEEHLAPADSTVVVPTDEPVSLPGGTEPVIPPCSINITIGARITVLP